jgi:hypothetical protein
MLPYPILQKLLIRILQEVISLKAYFRVWDKRNLLVLKV